MKSLSAGLLDALVRPDLSTASMLHLSIQSENLYYTTWPRSFDWSSQTWLSSANFLDMPSIPSTAEITRRSVQVALSGANAANLAILLGDSSVLNPLVIYRAFFDVDTYQLIDVFKEFSGYIDSWTYDEEPETGAAQLVVTAVRGLLFDKIVGRRTCAESQKIFFPDDTGLDAAGVSMNPIKWG